MATVRLSIELSGEAIAQYIEQIKTDFRDLEVELHTNFNGVLFKIRAPLSYNLDEGIPIAIGSIKYEQKYKKLRIQIKYEGGLFRESRLTGSAKKYISQLESIFRHYVLEASEFS